MVIDVPDWATRHNYYHHSNPRSKDRAKNLFEKVHVRPAIDQAWTVLKDAESTGADRIKANELLDRLTKNRGTANMKAGVAVQKACDLHLIPDQFNITLSLPEATLMAINMMQDYAPVDALDGDKKSIYIDELPKVIENAVLGLKEAMALDNRIVGEIELLDTLPGNALPHNTFPDYARRGDLKTKWPSPAKTRSGWKSAALPKHLGGMFDLNNVYQAAGFWALNGRQPPFLVYANSSNFQVFTPDNCDELKDDYLEDVVADIALHHKTTENMLRCAENKEDLLGLVSPDWNSIYWKEPEPYLAEAKKLWGV